MRTPAPSRRGTKGIFASILLVLALLLSACGATVDTNLSFSKEGAGTRTIVATLDTENLSEHADGGLKAITASIKKHTPKQLTFKGMKENKADNEAVATFVMSFDSFEDYTKKVDELLAASGSDAVAEINTVIENNDFVNGFATEENFTSTDLLGWAQDGLVEDGVISESDASSVFSDGDSKVKFDGKNYESPSARIDVDKVKDYGFDEIDVNTTLNEDGTFSQEVIYQIDKQKAAKLGKKLAAFLDSALVDGELEDYYGNGNYTGYTQKFTASDVQDLGTKTGKALGSKKASYEFTHKPDEQSPTLVVASLKGTLDCDTICSPSGERVKSQIQFPASYSYTEGTQAQSRTGDNGELIIIPQGANFAANATRQVPFESAHVNTEVSFNGSVEQEYSYSVSKANAALVGDGFAKLLTPQESVGSLETEETDNSVIYKVDISASSADELTEKLQNYVSGAWFATIHDEGFSLWPDYYVSLSWNPSAQLNEVEFTNGVTAEVQLPFAHKFKAESTGISPENFDGGKMSLSGEEGVDASVGANGPTTASTVAIGAIILVVLIALALLFIFRKRISSAGKKAWDKRDEAIAAGKKAAAGVAAASAAAGAGVSASVANATTAGEAWNAPEQTSSEFTEADLI